MLECFLGKMVYSFTDLATESKYGENLVGTVLCMRGQGLAGMVDVTNIHRFLCMELKYRFSKPRG